MLTRQNDVHQGEKVRTDYVPMPPQIILKYKYVTICDDVMRVNGIRLFITRSRHLNFITIQHIINGKDETFLQCIQNVKRIYFTRGFQLCEAIMDGEFKSLRNSLHGEKIFLNISSENEHVAEITHIRATYTSLPLTKFRVVSSLNLYTLLFFGLMHFVHQKILLMGSAPVLLLQDRSTISTNIANVSLVNMCIRTIPPTTLCAHKPLAHLRFNQLAMHKVDTLPFSFNWKTTQPQPYYDTSYASRSY